MEGTVAVAIVGLLGTAFTAVWGWLTTRKRQDQDSRIAATNSAIDSLREANDELREELKRLARDRDEARRNAAQTAEQVLGVLADTINKNTASSDALADVIRESVTASIESRRAMQVAAAAMTSKLNEVAAGQDALRADVRAHFTASAAADAAIQERMDQVYENLAALLTKHDEDAQARARTVLETIEALLSAPAAGV